MLISVITPCYNNAAWIEKAIQSVMAQTYTNWEMIIIDNNSTDNLAVVVQPYLSERIRLIAEPVQGPASAKNAGVRAAQGEWVAFLDADDVWLATRLEKLARCAQAHPASQVVLSDYLEYRNGIPYERYPSCHPVDTARFVEGLMRFSLFLDRTKGIFSFPGGTFFMRRDAFLAMGGMDPDFEIYEDWQLGMRFLLHGFGCEVLPEKFLLYRKHGHSICDRIDPGVATRAMEAVYRLYPEVLQKHQAVLGTDFMFSLETITSIRYVNYAFEGGRDQEFLERTDALLAQFPENKLLREIYAPKRSMAKARMNRRTSEAPAHWRAPWQSWLEQLPYLKRAVYFSPCVTLSKKMEILRCVWKDTPRAGWLNLALLLSGLFIGPWIRRPGKAR